MITLDDETEERRRTLIQDKRIKNLKVKPSNKYQKIGEWNEKGGIHYEKNVNFCFGIAYDLYCDS